MRTIEAIATETAVKCYRQYDPLILETIIYEAMQESTVSRLNIAIVALQFYCEHDDNGQTAQRALLIINP